MSDDKSVNQEMALLLHLYEKTKEGGIEWGTSDANGVFQCSIGAFVIRLRAIADPDWPEKPDFEIRVINEATGQELERITNNTLRPVMDRQAADGLSPYALMDRLFEMARRKALKVDEAIQSILNSLRDK